jgi:hypothetical protein
MIYFIQKLSNIKYVLIYRFLINVNFKNCATYLTERFYYCYHQRALHFIPHVNRRSIPYYCHTNVCGVWIQKKGIWMIGIIVYLPSMSSNVLFFLEVIFERISPFILIIQYMWNCERFESTQRCVGYISSIGSKILAWRKKYGWPECHLMMYKIK